MGGIVYFIKCLETQEVYIGSTKRKLNIRMNDHKSHFNCKSRQIIDRGNYFYDTLEVVEDDEDILIREQYYINTMKNCINANRAYITPEQKLEYDRQYYQDNRDKIIEKNKEYYQDNRDELLDYKKKMYQENRDELLEKQKKYNQENRDKILDYKKKMYHYKNSWGGEQRTQNNLLLIDINLFHY